ncbi:hypothetical protein [Rhodococcus sp. BP22]|uniref:hypothetical protein n=1 Tax=Rhodococcus sp. BP22 TaxID=2758566 RepID=UPI001646960D|nr:hypothetical protein [Rhodococcus sp. BP22]
MSVRVEPEPRVRALAPDFETENRGFITESLDGRRCLFCVEKEDRASVLRGAEFAD